MLIDRLRKRPYISIDPCFALEHDMQGISDHPSWTWLWDRKLAFSLHQKGKGTYQCMNCSLTWKTWNVLVLVIYIRLDDHQTNRYQIYVLDQKQDPEVEDWIGGTFLSPPFHYSSNGPSSSSSQCQVVLRVHWSCEISSNVRRCNSWLYNQSHVRLLFGRLFCFGRSR